MTTAVLGGLKPFAKQIRREVTAEDVERLLKIPIRRISLYDINKAREELQEIEARMKEVRKHLKHITEYAEGFLDELVREYGGRFQRKTVITSFQQVDVREAAAAQRNLDLRYDEETGYIGTEVKTGRLLFQVSSYDRVIIIRRTGAYSVINVPDRLFVDKGMYHCAMADKEEMARTIITAVYKDKTTGFPFIKRCIVDKFILDKGYTLVDDNQQMLCLTTRRDAVIRLIYAPKARLKITEQDFKISWFAVKGIKAGGVRLAAREAATGETVDAEKKPAGAKGSLLKKAGEKAAQPKKKTTVKAKGKKKAGAVKKAKVKPKKNRR